MKSLKLDRVVGKRPDNKNDYLKIKPELPANLGRLPKKQPSIKKSHNIKKGKWHY